MKYCLNVYRLLVAAVLVCLFAGSSYADEEPITLTANSRQLQCGTEYVITPAMDPSANSQYDVNYYLDGVSLSLSCPSGCTLYITGEYSFAGNSHVLSLYDAQNPDEAVGIYSNHPISPLNRILYESSTSGVMLNFKTSADCANNGYYGFRIIVKVCRTSNESVSNVNITPGSRSVYVTWDDNSGSSRWQVCYGSSVETGYPHCVSSNNQYVTISNLEPSESYHLRITSGNNSCNCQNNNFYFATTDEDEETETFDFTDLYSPNVTCQYSYYDYNYSYYGYTYYLTAWRTGVVDGRHTVVRNREVDPHSGIYTIPDDSDVSVRLGNSSTGAQTEAIVYRYTVNASVNDLLVFRYAVILEDPNHSQSEQPLMQFEMFTIDEYGNEVSLGDCYNETYIAGYGTGWHLGSICWKDWTSVGVNLEPYDGQTIYIRVLVRDCLQSGHFGYCYYTLNVYNKRIESSNCGENLERDLTAPDGFSYQWFRDNDFDGVPDDGILSTNRTYHSTTNDIFKVIIGSLVSADCVDTLAMQVTPRYPKSDFTYTIKDTVNCGIRLKMRNTSIVYQNRELTLPVAPREECNSYEWYVNGHLVSTEKNPVIEINIPGPNTIKLVSGINGGCTHESSATFVNGLSGVSRSYVETVCDSFYWGMDGETYYSSGVHVSLGYGPDGCIVSDTLNLTVNHSTTGIDEQSACDSYVWDGGDGMTYRTSTMTPTWTFPNGNAAGCDSTVTLNLTVNYSTTSVDPHNVCDSLRWHGTTYTRSNNTATYLTTNAAGCDSTVTLALTVRYSTSSVDPYNNVCDSLRWHGTTYTSSNSTATYRTTNAADCDSTVTLNLTVNHSSTGIDEFVECDSLRWIDGNTYYVNNNTAMYHMLNHFGCDSAITLSLVVRYSNSYIDNQMACSQFAWTDGVVYTESNSTARQVLQNVSGCDSVVTLNLYVRYPQDIVIDTTFSCDDGTYTLTLKNDLEVWSWMVLSGENFVEGAAHDTAVTIVVEDTMGVAVTADYSTMPSCPSSSVFKLVPLVVKADMRTIPDILLRDNFWLQAEDMSTGNLGRYWYVDGLYMSDVDGFRYEPGYYDTAVVVRLEAYNDYCADTVERRIRVIKEEIFAPNVFTPDIEPNKIFLVKGSGILEFEMDVYNRGGLRVFHTNDINTGWDGTCNGKPLPQAGYVYFIRYRGEMDPDGYKTKTGSVLLLR